MIKLSELSNEKAINIICEITEPALNILTDKKIIKELQKNIKKEDITVAEINRLGIVKISNLINIITKNYKDDFYKLFAPFFELNVEEFKKYSFLKTVNGIKEILNDKEFMDFLAELLKSKNPT